MTLEVIKKLSLRKRQITYEIIKFIIIIISANKRERFQFPHYRFLKEIQYALHVYISCIVDERANKVQYKIFFSVQSPNSHSHISREIISKKTDI